MSNRFVEEDEGFIKGQGGQRKTGYIIKDETPEVQTAKTVEVKPQAPPAKEKR